MKATASSGQRERLVIVGNGMVGHHCVEQLVSRGALQRFEVRVFGEERQRAYDRVHLSEYFGGSCAETLALCEHDFYDANGVHLHLGEAVLEIDRERREVVTAEGRYGYDQLVLATGSYPFVPPIEAPAAMPAWSTAPWTTSMAFVLLQPVPAEGWWSAVACLAWKRPTPSSRWGWKPTWWNSPHG